jgi:hypothetical protein
MPPTTARSSRTGGDRPPRGIATFFTPPEVSIQVGTRTTPVTALPLDADEGADIFVRYASQHRTTAKYVLPRVLGFSVDGSDADFRVVGQRMPFVRFLPWAEL